MSNIWKELKDEKPPNDIPVLAKLDLEEGQVVYEGHFIHLNPKYHTHGELDHFYIYKYQKGVPARNVIFWRYKPDVIKVHDRKNPGHYKLVESIFKYKTSK